jgi:hypothetical protein
LPSKPKAKYVVANPRGIPEGRHIISDKDGKRWFEGDAYDGDVSDRLVSGGFLVEVKHAGR